MDTKKPAEAESKGPETTTPSPDSSGQKSRNDKKAGRSKKPIAPDERIAMTFSVSLSFAKKLKMLGGGLPESLSDYVESKLAPIVSKDLKKVLEEMG